MPLLADRQAALARALLDDAAPVPIGIDGPAGSVCRDRFGVYRANIAVSLVEALRDAFPVVNRLVGEDFFTAMARAHAIASPPMSPVLLEYGRGFPDFIAGFEPAAGLPYLPDVARLEWLWLETYHAAEDVAVAPDRLAAVPGDHIPALRFHMHPATRFAVFDYPVIDIWRRHQGADAPGEFHATPRPDHVLLARPDANVSVIALTAGAFLLLCALERGRTLGDAVVAALSVEPALDAVDALSLLFAAGAFARFEAREPGNRDAGGGKRS